MRAATHGRDTEGKTWSSVDAAKIPQVLGYEVSPLALTQKHTVGQVSQKIMYLEIWAGFLAKAFTAQR